MLPAALRADLQPPTSLDDRARGSLANNMITFTQQYLIMRSQGFKPDVFGNIRQSFQRKKAE